MGGGAVPQKALSRIKPSSLLAAALLHFGLFSFMLRPDMDEKPGNMGDPVWVSAH
jgi:hypothetical protein